MSSHPDQATVDMWMARDATDQEVNVPPWNPLSFIFDGVRWALDSCLGVYISDDGRVVAPSGESWNADPELGVFISKDGQVGVPNLT